MLRLEGIELWNSTNTAPVRTGREGGGHKLTLFPFNGAGRGAIPPELNMNAIAEREVCAYELAERRRAYIAEQIRNCLYGKTLYVNIAWTLQSIPQRVSRMGLIQEMENALLVSSSAGFDYSAKLLAALDDESLRPALRTERERIIGDWADTTHNCMTEQELEALPC